MVGPWFAGFVECFGFVIEFVVGVVVCRWFGLLERVLLNCVLYGCGCYGILLRCYWW